MHNSESNFFHLEKVKFLGVVALLKVLKSTHFQTLLCFYFKRLNNALDYNNNNTLFRKKRFEINFFVRQNASKFAIFIEKENPCSFFRFSFRATLSFTL